MILHCGLTVSLPSIYYNANFCGGLAASPPGTDTHAPFSKFLAPAASDLPIGDVLKNTKAVILVESMFVLLLH